LILGGTTFRQTLLTSQLNFGSIEIISPEKLRINTQNNQKQTRIQYWDKLMIFFLWWPRFEHRTPYIYYVLSLPTDLSLRGQIYDLPQ